MNILVLGPFSSPITEFLLHNNFSVIEHVDQVDISYLEKRKIDFAISYKYRHIIRPEIITYLNGNVINLHISYLPWNRGSDPNLWSFLENTPKGISIHYVDSGIDTGDIIIQKEVVFDEMNETLSSTYNYLNYEIIRLFKNNWDFIINGLAPRRRQTCTGTSHRSRDKKPYQYLLEKNGWDTPVKIIRGVALHKKVQFNSKI